MESPRALSRWAVLAGISCGLGMACKEVMVTAPVIVLLFERNVHRRIFSCCARQVVAVVRWVRARLGGAAVA